jgi:mannose-1-phosphate guanylyltransferase
MSNSSDDGQRDDTKVYAVIMAGGAGTRFWPASRELRPKQLLALAGDDDETLLAATVRRLAPLVPPERVYIATGKRLVEATAKALPQVPRANMLAEPVPRNTAPCIGWAAATIARQDPDAVVMVLPSDHFIEDEAGFRAVLARALAGARAGFLTTIGIVPTRPETGYGYIEVGPEVQPGLTGVARFVEKPDLARAQAYVDGKKHLWNAGMFFFQARVMKEAIDRFLPDLGRGLDALDRAAAESPAREAASLEEIFPTLPSISIDHGVMEKAPRLAVVEGSFGWNDVGSWQSAWELAEKDADGNALPPGGVTVDARGNLVSDRTTGAGAGVKKVFALVGVSDLVVVETDDAVLIIPRERAQDVRAVVQALKTRGDAKLT